MATRKLEVMIVGDADSLKRALKSSGQDVDKFGRKLDDGHGRTSRFGGAISKLGPLAMSGGAALAGGLAVGAYKCIDAFQESEKVAAQTNAVIKSTGGVANVSAKQVGDLAGAISRKSGIDDEAIQSGENLLLTFTGIRNEAGKGNDVFNQTVSIAADMATALGTDVKSASMQLGKALNDPEKGITKLTRAGVTFTEAQKKQIVAMTKSGDVMGAQKLMLAELRKEFGGSAEAAGNTTAGAFNKLKVAVGNVEEAIGGALAPVVKDAAEWLGDFVSGFQSGTGAGGAFRREVQKIGDGIGAFFKAHRHDFDSIGDAVKSVAKDALPLLAHAWDFMKATAGRALPGVISMLRGFAQTVKGVVEVISGILTLDFDKAWRGVKDIFGGAVKAIFGQLRAATAPFRELVTRIWRGMGDGIRSAGTAVFGAARSVLDGMLSVVKTVFAPIKAYGTFMIHVWAKAINAAGGIGSAIGKQVGRVVSGIRSVFDWVKDAGGDIVHLLGKGIGAAGGLFSAALDKVKDVTKGVRSIFSTVKDAGADIVHLIARGISGAGGLFTAASDKVGDVIGGIMHFFGNGFSKAVQIGESLVKAIARGLTGAAGLAKAAANVVIRTINNALGGVRISWTIPVIDKKISIGFPKTVIPELAVGARNFAGGMALVGEKGPELVNLPRGSDVYTARETRSMVGATGNPRGNAGRALDLMRKVWPIASQYLGPLAAGAPMPRTFFTTGSDALFAGVDANPKVRPGRREMFWPDWVSKWMVSKNPDLRYSALKLLIHEWAHEYQSKATIGTDWTSEGGAEAFARLMAPRIFAKAGVPYGFTSRNGDPYNKFVGHVMGSKGYEWVKRGQFAAFASGVRDFSGGPALVGEEGPELVRLPGSRSVSSGGGTATIDGRTFELNVYNYGDTLNERQIADRLAFSLAMA